jgi:hypothetical protein
MKIEGVGYPSPEVYKSLLPGKESHGCTVCASLRKSECMIITFTHGGGQ